jgi:hypothetical protein
MGQEWVILNLRAARARLPVVRSTVTYRIVTRATREVTVAGFEPNINWQVGDTVILNPTRRYVIVEIEPGDETVEATLLVDELPTRGG